MTYIAKHFVKIAGRMYTPGEIIDASAFADGGAIQRMERLGAIVPDAEAAAKFAAVTLCEEAADAQDLPAGRDVLESADGCAPVEADEDDASAMEIDAMDGVVSEKPRKAGRKKK